MPEESLDRAGRREGQGGMAAKLREALGVVGFGEDKPKSQRVKR